MHPSIANTGAQGSTKGKPSPHSPGPISAPKNTKSTTPSPFERFQGPFSQPQVSSPNASRGNQLFDDSQMGDDRPCEHPPHESPSVNMSKPSATITEPTLNTVHPPESSQHMITSLFQNAHHFSIGGNARFLNVGGQNNATSVNNYYHSASGLNVLEKFVSFSALHDSSAQDPERRCHPGTREGVLKRIREWVENPDSPEPILWLHGPAGVGKSAIAQTISHSYSRENVVATFFFFKSDPMRSDGNLLFPTLSWQLAIAKPEVKGFIIHSLDENPGLPTKSVEIQFEQLIARPLKSIMKDISPTPVIIVDGVDECSDEKLQRRFLNSIGKAVIGHRFPLRFLICSRPEAHIRDTFYPFQRVTLRIDISKTDEVYRDIEMYLKSEFSRIASEQQIDSASWPGADVIQDIVDKSSGQFVYPSTIIKFVGDEYNSATSQLDIILGLKPINGSSPFAALDSLYIEILRRQPDQKFLKDFLGVLVGRTHLGNEYARTFVPPLLLARDDALLLNVDEKVLHRKLRGMHSLLAFKPHIDIHHRSFLDFLQDSSRSHQYHVSEGTTRRYLELIVDALVRYATKVIKRPQYHEATHFAPEFGKGAELYPRPINLPLQDWEEIFLPLLNLHNEWLKFAELSSPWKRGACAECTHFRIINCLLSHLMFFRGITNFAPSPYRYQPEARWDTGLSGAEELGFYGLPGDELNRTRVYNDNGGKAQLPEPDLGSSVQPEKTGSTQLSQLGGSSQIGASHKIEGLESCLSLLFSKLQNMKPGLQMRTETLRLVCTVLNFDHAEIALRISSISDAQNLLDLIFYVISNRLFPTRSDQYLVRNATQLALEIHTRVPVLPRCLFLNKANIQINGSISTSRACNGTISWGDHEEKVIMWTQFSHGIDAICHRAIISAALSHENILPLLGFFEDEERYVVVYPRMPNDTLRKWRRNMIPSATEIQRSMLGVAKAVQYMHSLDLVFDDLSPKFVFLDSNFHAKVAGNGLSIRYFSETRSKNEDPSPPHLWPRESNLFMFGRLYYEVYFDIDLPLHNRFLLDRTDIIKRPSGPEISDTVWSLIQRCCAENPKDRPTIENVVEELESWK